MEGTITTIQRMSVHDGAGIRSTLFLKGCGMRCRWCHNPETWGGGVQLQQTAGRCIGCGSCLEACPSSALSLTAEGIRIDRRNCTVCGDCVGAQAPLHMLAKRTRTALQVPPSRKESDFSPYVTPFLRPVLSITENAYSHHSMYRFFPYTSLRFTAFIIPPRKMSIVFDKETLNFLFFIKKDCPLRADSLSSIRRQFPISNGTPPSESSHTSAHSPETRSSSGAARAARDSAPSTRSTQVCSAPATSG